MAGLIPNRLANVKGRHWDRSTRDRCQASRSARRRLSGPAQIRRACHRRGEWRQNRRRGATASTGSCARHATWRGRILQFVSQAITTGGKWRIPNTRSAFKIVRQSPL